jgi:hypothetical protein
LAVEGRTVVELRAFGRNEKSALFSAISVISSERSYFRIAETEEAV